MSWRDRVADSVGKGSVEFTRKIGGDQAAATHEQVLKDFREGHYGREMLHAAQVNTQTASHLVKKVFGR